MECLDTHCSNLGQSFPAQPRVVQRSIFATILVALLVMYGFTVAYVSNQSSAANSFRSKNYATFDFPAPPNATNVGNPVIVQIKWTQANTQIAGSTLVASLHFIYPSSMLVGQAPKKATKGVIFSFDSGQIFIEQLVNGMRRCIHPRRRIIAFLVLIFFCRPCSHVGTRPLYYLLHLNWHHSASF